MAGMRDHDAPNNQALFWPRDTSACHRAHDCQDAAWRCRWVGRGRSDGQSWQPLRAPARV